MTNMREVPLAGGPVEFRGALDLERRATGLMPRRLPAWTREQYPDAFMDFVTTGPSGVRLAFRTAATALQLDVLTLVRRLDGEPPPASSGQVDLRLDGAPAGSADVPAGDVLKLRHPRDEGRLVRGRPGTVCFGGLPGHLKEVELWLPQATPCELVALRADAPVGAPAPTGRRRWVHHGSSISHGAEADSPTGTWPVVAATRAGVEVVNLGFAGNAMLDPYVARTIRDFDADLISIKVGVNIVGGAGFTPRTFGPAVEGFLDTVRDGHPDAPLLVVSPIILPAAEDVHERAPGAGDTGFGEAGADDPPSAAGITMTRLRTTLAAIVGRRARSDHHLYFLDGRELLGKDDLRHLPDGTHPDAGGHRLIGERFATQVFGADGPFQ